MDLIDIYFKKKKISYKRLIATIVYLSILFLIILILSIYDFFIAEFNFCNLRKKINDNNNNINNNNPTDGDQNNNQNKENNNILNTIIPFDQDNKNENENNKNINTNEIKEDIKIINVENNNNINKKSDKKSLNMDIIQSQSNLLNSEVSRLTRKPLCIICQSNPTKIILAPCGHRCLCQECYKEKKNEIKKCPLCIKPVQLCLENIYDI